MKTIIAGSRSINNYALVLDACVESCIPISEIISGGARGVDTVAQQIAREFNIPLTIMPAKWQEHGKIAGFLRNEEMARYADALIAVWDGRSSGTKHMITIARKFNLRIHIYANNN